MKKQKKTENKFEKHEKTLKIAQAQTTHKKNTNNKQKSKKQNTTKKKKEKRKHINETNKSKNQKIVLKTQKYQNIANM